MSVLIFLAVLFVLVLVHELGHFAVAKWTGMRVDEFGIGFPPKLFGIKKGETEYTFNLFPIGGFVKIFGEDGDGTPSARLSENISEQGEGNSPLSGQSRYGKDGAREGGEDIKSVGSRSFVSKSKWAQSAVLLAGVTMNILFAWLLVTLTFTMGVETSVTEEEATPAAELTVTNVLPGSPAEGAAFAPGAVVKSVESEGETLKKLTPSAFSEFVGAHEGALITIAYVQGGELRVAQMTSKTGIIEAESDKPAIGVALSLVEEVERSFGEAVVDGFMYTVTGLRDIAVGISGLLYDAILLRADLSQVAGPVGIVGLVGEASAYGITALFMFTAFISLNLAIINILPFPALDGGRLLFVIIEAVKGSPIPARYAVALNMVGFTLLILLMFVVTWNDIARLI